MTEDVFPAIEARDIDRLRRLLDADPGLVHARLLEGDAAGQTPLHRAAARGDLAACRLLVERGAEVYSNPMASYPAVMEAAWNGHDDVVRWFLEEIPDRAEGTGGLGVTIHLAGRQGWIDVVRKHVERDPLAVHQRGWIGDTPLHWPAHNGHVEIVRLLLDAGADIEAHENNCYGGPPLHWASEHAPSVVRLLLDRGADVHSRNRRPGSAWLGATALIVNARQKEDCAEAAEMLVEAGADVHALDATGKSALDHAAARGLTRIQAVLRKHA